MKLEGLYESKLRECLERACRSVDGETEMMRENDGEKDHDDRNQGQRENTSKRKDHVMRELYICKG